MKNAKVSYITGNTSMNKKHASCNIALKKSTYETVKYRSKCSDTYHNVVVPNWNDGIEEFGVD